MNRGYCVLSPSPLKLPSAAMSVRPMSVDNYVIRRTSAPTTRRLQRRRG
ncbi:hypothetical protein [Candidatus Regiella insecticola]|nr:hypothetical protein [Candidatus Regiella insecticola]